MGVNPVVGQPGTAADFSVVMTNPHGGPIGGVSAVVTLPPGVEFVGASGAPDGSSYDAGSHTVTLLVGTMQAGQTTSMTIQVRVRDAAAAGSTLTATAAIWHDTLNCMSVSATLTLTPLGIPVTGAGPGLEELSGLLGSLLAAAAVLTAGWVTVRRTLRGR
jgi:hypothetical protein